MIVAPPPTNRLLVCLCAEGYPASLEVRKVYRSLPDAAAEAKGFVRVLDESGEDYLYPSRFFEAINEAEPIAMGGH